MIIRIFRAIVHDGKQDEFENFFLTQAIPHVKSQKGLISLSIGTPFHTSPNEFMMIMIWKDLDSIKSFAGENWQNAVILEDERDLLKEVFVHHYESVD
jgi:heme-degrading monooxygenase HmoA